MSFINYPPTIAVALLFGIVAILSLRQYLKWNAQQFRLPPGPLGFPLVGSLPFLGKILHRHFASLAHTYGPVLSLRLGCKLCVVLTSPSAAHEIFKDQDASFANRDTPAAMRFYFGTSPVLLWSPYGPQWRMLRKLAASQVLNLAKIEAVMQNLRREVRRTVAAVWERAKVGSAVDVREIILITILDTTTSMLWGERLSGGDGVAMRFWWTVEEMIGLVLKPNVADFYPVIARFDPQGLGRRVRRHMEWLHSFLDEIVERKKKDIEGSDGDKTNDVMTSVLQLMQRRDPELAALTMNDFKNFTLDILAGSTETITTTIEWILAELLIHPEMMRKVQQELDATIGKDRVVEESDIDKLRYLNAVLKETLRLHPPTPLLVPHTPSINCTVGSFSIPAGTAVFVNAWAIHRDPKVWKDPVEFKPERFLEEGMDKQFNYKGGNEFGYLPFGAGRRACAGIMLAEKMIMYSLASLLHSFDWQLPEGAEKSVLSERFGIVLRKAENLVTVPALRLDRPELYA